MALNLARSVKKGSTHVLGDCEVRFRSRAKDLESRSIEVELTYNKHMALCGEIDGSKGEQQSSEWFLNRQYHC